MARSKIIISEFCKGSIPCKIFRQAAAVIGIITECFKVIPVKPGNAALAGKPLPGLPEEAAVLAKELTALRIPAAAVLGNHDLESGKSGVKILKCFATALNFGAVFYCVCAAAHNYKALQK